jgi:hypothetical protein
MEISGKNYEQNYDNHIKRLSPDCISPQRGFSKNKINQSKLSYKIVGKRTLNNSPTLQTK